MWLGNVLHFLERIRKTDPEEANIPLAKWPRNLDSNPLFPLHYTSVIFIFPSKIYHVHTLPVAVALAFLDYATGCKISDHL